MSSNVTTNTQQSSPSGLCYQSCQPPSNCFVSHRRYQLTCTINAVSKSKKHRKKKPGGKDKFHENGESVNGVNTEKSVEQSHVETDEQEQELEASLSSTEFTSKIQEDALAGKMVTNGDKPPNRTVNSGAYQMLEKSTSEAKEAVIPLRDASHISKPTDELQLPESQYRSEKRCSENTEARLDALAREREILRDEVAQLRRSLEELQGKHEEELIDVKGQLEETQGEKDHAETQYRNLLGKVNTIKSQLGERLKADAVCSKRTFRYEFHAHLILGRPFPSQRHHWRARAKVWGFTRTE